MKMCSRFQKLFDCHLDEFWGRIGKDMDGGMRRQPCNVKGFDYEAFGRAFKLKLDLKQPLKSIRKPLLSVVKAKWGDEGFQIISSLVPTVGSRRQNKE